MPRKKVVTIVEAPAAAAAADGGGIDNAPLLVVARIFQSVTKTGSLVQHTKATARLAAVAAAHSAPAFLAALTAAVDRVLVAAREDASVR
jgi:hypothetical protein